MLYSNLLNAYFMETIYLLIVLLTVCAIYLTLHILQGIGLYKLSKRAGYRHAWIAFVPFLCDYRLGKLAGECSFFGQKIKHGGVYYALSDFLYKVASFLSVYVQLFLSPYFDVNLLEFVGVPETLRWASIMNTILDYVIPVLSIFYSVFTVIVLFSFFRKYAMRNAWIFTFTSLFFPIQGAFIFAVRNNAPIDYERYMRAQREAFYRRQQQYYGGNPYERPPYSNPYQGNPSSNGGESRKDDPFEEFHASEEERSENDEFFK